MAFTKLHSIILEKIKNDPIAQKAFERKINNKIPLKELAAYFNIQTKSRSVVGVDKKINIAYDLINEAYSHLSAVEKEYVGLISSHNKLRVSRQIKIIESLIGVLKSKKEKELATECLVVLKKDIAKRSLIEAAERTLDLKETIKTLLESEDHHGGVITQKLGNLNYLKDVRLAVMFEEKDAPETLYITFKTPFYPIGNDFSAVKASLTDLDQKFGRMGRNILNKTIFDKGRKGQIFTGEGIWDGGVRINAIKPGTMSEGNGELVLHIVPNSLHSVEEAKKAITPLLKDLDALIPIWFPEAKKEGQKNYKKEPTADVTDRLNTLKQTTRRLRGDDQPVHSDEFGGAF